MENKTQSAVEPRPPSQTAKVAAMCRGVHCILGEDPKLLMDSYARGLLGFPGNEARLKYFNAQPASGVLSFSIKSKWTRRVAAD